MPVVLKFSKPQKTKWLWLLFIFSFFLISAERSSSLTLEILPEKATITPGGTVFITLLARNDSTNETFTNLNLEIFPTSNIHVEISEEPDTTSVGHGSFVRWQLTLTDIGLEEYSIKINFQVSFVRISSGGENIKDAILDSLDVSVVAPPNIVDQVNLSIQSPIAALNENEDGWIYLEVSNSSYDPILITTINIQSSEDLEISYPSALNAESNPNEFELNIEIPGYHTKIIPFMIITPERVNPTDALLVFNLDLKRKHNGLEYSGSLTETHSIKIGVFGESDILKVLTAVPSMLFLPGFVFLLGWALISRFTLEEPLYNKLPLKVTSVEFWIVSISVSLLAAVILNSNPLLDKYNFNDIGRVWFISFLFGITAGLSLWLTISAIKSQEARKLAMKTPTVNDTPLELLEKLARQGFSTKLKKVRLLDKNQKVFLLQSEKDDQTAYMVGPRIMVVWKFEKDEDLYNKAQQLVDEDQDLNELIKLIRQGLSEEKTPSIVSVEYDKSGQIKMPVKKNITSLVLEGEYSPFIEFDEK